MKPLTEWIDADFILYWSCAGIDTDIVDELLRREREAMKERCVALCDESQREADLAGQKARTMGGEGLIEACYANQAGSLADAIRELK